MHIGSKNGLALPVLVFTLKSLPIRHYNERRDVGQLREYEDRNIPQMGWKSPGSAVAIKTIKESTQMAEKNQNLQDAFLNEVRKQKIPLTIFLVNGVKLNGIVSWFDNFCVLLRRDGISQLVYKHAISTIMPGAPVLMGDRNDEAE